MIDIPESFARETIGREGEPGRTWIAGLACSVDEVLQRWSCVPDGPVMHGNVGIVVPVRAVKAALWGRGHGDPDWLIAATDQLAEILL
ncbi:hypothetical protein ACFV24_10500 [Nocardia fluminea]|uniref:hypothetical protein n=1 Tax=Nocardia fluminea TaxID=134984 RepID=UPI00366DF3C8